MSVKSIISRKELNQLKKDLERFVDIEGTELGEACALLCELSKYPDYVSEGFLSSLIKEMKLRLKNFEENAEIIETEETITYTRPVVDLRWKSE